MNLDLLISLAQKELRVRYRTALFGYFWAAALPLLSAGLYAAAFKMLSVPRPGLGWGSFLIGVAAWQWAAGAVACAPGLYLRSLSLVRSVPLRWGHHAAAAALCEGAPLLAVLPIAVALGAARGELRDPLALAAMPLLALAQTAAFAGWTCAAASANVVLRDVERLGGLLTAALFFATPVVFVPELLPPLLRTWLMLNPAAVFVEAWRGAFDGTLGAPLLAAAAAHAAFGLALAAAVEGKWGRRLPEFA